MSDLAAFLAARLDEDEAMARETGPARVAWLTLVDEAGQLAYTTVAAACGDDEWVADGNLREPAFTRVIYDPARVLREVEAKRAILAGHKIGSHPEVRTIEHHNKQWNTGSIERNETGRTVYWCQTCDYDRDFGYIGDAREGCDTVRALAAVWSDHPDYDQAWRPVAP